MPDILAQTQQHLVRAYRIYQKMMRYPHLTEAMRKIFRSVLLEKASVDTTQIRKDAETAIQKEKIEPTEENLREYMDATVDLALVNHFDDEEIDQYINLARKEDRLQNLIKVVNTEGVTSLRIKKALRDFCEIPEGTTFVPPSEAEGVRVALIHHFISNQLPFLGIAKHHITIRDIDGMVKHSYWSPRYPGRIGGKAAGLLLAYRIILPRLTERDPELDRYLAITESYYFNSGIFSDFVDYNDLHELHTHKYKNRNDIEETYRRIPSIMEKATFPPDVEADIVPIAIYPDQKGAYIDEGFLLEAANQLPATLPDHAQHASVVHLIHVPASTNGQLLHIHQDGKKQEGMGFFAGALSHLARV